MRVALHPCYVLHQRAYRETSLTLEVLSRDHGRVPLVAKGAKRARSPYRFVLQPFRKLALAWTLRAEMGTLTQAEPAAPPPRLSADALMAGFYVHELLLRLLHRHEPHPGIYDAYEAALTGLSGTGRHEPCLRVFEKRLLLGLGYGLALDRDVESGTALDPDAEYAYDIDRGPTLRPRPGATTIPVSGAALSALSRESFADERQLDEAKRLMRGILAGHLGVRPLSSRDLYRRMLLARERA